MPAGNASGTTTFGGNQQKQVGVVEVVSASTFASFIKLQDTAGVPYWLGVDTAGKVRVYTALPGSPNSDGTKVGTQT